MNSHGVLLISGKRTHQENHSAAFLTHPDCRIVAVADEADVSDYRAALNRQLADDLNVPYVPDLDAALALDGVDIVSMCADVERRGRVAVKCAEAGKHMYMDKPLAGSVRDAHAIADAVGKANVRTRMWSLILAPWAQAAKRALESGAVGDLRAVHVEVLFAKGKPGTVPEGTVRQEKHPVEKYTFVEAKRELFDIGVYAVGLAHWLTGRRTESVRAITGNYFFAEHAKHDVEDFGAVLMGMQGGVTATAIGGRYGWTSHPKGGSQKIVLYGSKGTQTFDAWRPRIEVFSEEADFAMPDVHPFDPMGMWGSTQREAGVMPKRRWMTPFDERGTMVRDVAHFVDCVDRNIEPEMNAAFAAPLTEVLMAAYASAARGGPVTLPLE